VYGLRSGGWRPCAGDVPPHAPKGLCSRPPVFVDGYFYWHLNTEMNFHGREARFFRTPEPILSLSVDTEEFGVDTPAGRTGALRLPSRRPRRLSVRRGGHSPHRGTVRALDFDGCSCRLDVVAVVIALPHQLGEPAPADEGRLARWVPHAPARLLARRKHPSRHEPP
jgi:hypothetical protein